MNLDESVFHALNQAGSGLGPDLFMVLVSALGLTFIIVLAGPILWWRKQRELAFDAVVLILVSDLITEVLKLAVMRERPFEVLTEAHTLPWGWLATATSPSMPSGHAARAFALATLIALGTRLRWGAAAPDGGGDDRRQPDLSRTALAVGCVSGSLAGGRRGPGHALGREA